MYGHCDLISSLSRYTYMKSSNYRSLANGIEAACGGAAWEWTAILKSRNGVKKPGDLGYKW